MRILYSYLFIHPLICVGADSEIFVLYFGVIIQCSVIYFVV